MTVFMPAWILCATALTACGPGVTARPQPPERAFELRQRSVLTGDGPSAWTMRTSRFLGYELEGEFRVDRSVAIEGLLVQAQEDPLACVALSELLLESALELPAGGERDARLLMAAMQAWEGVDRRVRSGSAPIGEEGPLGLGVYNRAVGELAPSLHEALAGRVSPDDTLSVTGQFGGFVVSIEDRYDELRWGSGYFDELIYTDGLRLSGMRHTHRRTGVGAAMIGYRDQRPGGAAPFTPPEGIVYPVTARIEFERSEQGPARAALVLSDPNTVASIDVGGQRVDQSADFSAPLAYLHSKAELSSLGRRGLLDVDSVSERTGLYLLDPFTPDRVPVVLVHGLNSSPEAWVDLVNDIRGDPLLRDRVQVWMFLYPTSLPIPRSSYYLRSALEDVRRAYDPFDIAPGLDEMVVVGHSMGGILARSIMVDVGDSLWDSAFAIPLDEAGLAPFAEEHMRETFFYEPDADVTRVIFAAAPLRGSPIADNWLGKLGSWLVDESDEIEAVGKELQSVDGLFKGRARGWDGGAPTSIQNLSEQSPFLLTWMDQELTVAHHVIMGDRGKPDAKVPGDGVVPNSSSRLDTAASELVVPSGHNAHQHPQAIREIRRILRLHLTELDARQSAEG